jgi:hypothetical protein
VPLEHHDLDAGACQQQPEHHPRRAAPGDGYTRDKASFTR